MSKNSDCGPPVVRTRVQFDLDSQVTAYGRRFLAIADRNDGRAYYLGPAVTVACDSPTPAFWRAVYAEIGRWRGECRQYYGRRMVDHPEEWQDPIRPDAKAEHHQFHRVACVTGLLLVGGDRLLLSQWPSRKDVGYRPRRRGGRRVRERRG